MKAKSIKQAVLFLCHAPERQTLSEYRKISREAGSLADVYLAVHLRSDVCLEAKDGISQPLAQRNHNASRQSWAAPTRTWYFKDQDLSDLCCPRVRDSIVPGSAQFPLLYFFRRYSCYDFYWVIEFDVRFSGRWRQFFRSFDTNCADFLTNHIRRFEDEPGWCWWSLNHPEEHIPRSERLRSFNPIYRISSNALAHLYRLQRSGWCGHFEVLMPTLLYRAGYRLEDFGGNGQFVRAGAKNKFYLDAPPNQYGLLNGGTMRWRPAFTRVGRASQKLFHPVKPVS